MAEHETSVSQVSDGGDARHYRTLVDAVEEGLYRLDRRGNFVAVNETVAETAGYDREALLGRHVSTIFGETDLDRIERTVRSLLGSDADAATLHPSVRTADGDVVPCELRVGPVVEDGEFRGTVGVLRDGDDRAPATGREESAAVDGSLDGSGRQFQSLVDAVEEYAIFALDPDGRVVTWNEGARRIKGYEAEEIRGEHFSTFYTEADREAGVPERNLAAATEQGSVEDEGWRVRADGSRFWSNVTISAVRDDDGDLEGYVKVTRDMTERREREERLREEKAFVESLLDAQPDLVYAFDAEGQFVRWNDRVPDVTGYDDEAIAEMRPQGFVADEAADRTAAAIEAVLEDGERVTVDLPLETADGERIPYQFSAAPLTDEEGRTIGLTGVGRDVSQLRAQARRIERQRDELAAELDEVYRRIDDAVFALDEEWRFTHVNGRAEEYLQREESELLGATVWGAFPGMVDAAFESEYRRAMDTQEPTTFEAYYEPLETWFEVRAHPSESGLSVYFRDVSERKEREQELKRYERIVDTLGDPVYELDASGRFRYVNRAFVEQSGYDAEELIGEHVSVGMDPEAIERAVSVISDLLGDESRESARLEYDVRTSDGGRIPVENNIAPLTDEDGRFQGTVGVLRDVTERKERERELEKSRRRARTLVENVPNGAVALVDEDLRYVTVGGSPVVRSETVAELEGTYLRDALPPELADVLVPGYETALDGDASEVEQTVGDRIYQFHFVPVRDDDGEVFAAMGMSQDVTDRVERERELQRRIRQQGVITDLGQRALEDRDLDALMAEAVERVADTLDNDYCKVLDLDAEADRLLLRQGVGWDEGLVGSATVSAVEADSQAAYTLASEEPVVVEDLDAESRFGGPDLLADHDVASGISTIIGAREDPWGILGTHDTRRRGFSEHDANFVQSVATILATAIDRYRREQELIQQRERLAALDELNGVVREITDAVIDQSTREEIERTVCEALADSESYAFAWIGDVDASSRTVRMRTEAGVSGYLDGVTISVDPDDERSDGPTGRAHRTGEIQIAQDVQADPMYDPWRDHVEAYGVRSSAAIPVVHEGTTYGVLNIYADRPDAFTAEERAVIGQLGEVVGHAIAAVERKRALMSDEVVELDLRIEDAFAELDAPVGTEDRIDLDRVVPAGGGEYLVYGTTSGSGLAGLEAVVDAIPHWTAVRRIDDGHDGTAFEARLTEPPVLTMLASRGGDVRGAHVDGGDLGMRVQLPHGVDVREVVAGVQEVYPTAEVHAQRQVRRTDDGSRRVATAFEEELTDRQRTVLESAYFAGYFDWPRDSSGEDVAGSLSISPATFSQHLRTAEHRIFAALFEDAD